MEKITSPKENAADKFLVGTKAFVGMLPAGSLVAYLIDQIVKPQINERFKEWMEAVSILLNENTSEIDLLKNNQRFITNFIHTTQIAGRTHQKDKLKALQNAVVNSIPNPSYSESLIIPD